MLFLSLILGSLLLILSSYLIFGRYSFHETLCTLFIITAPIPLLAYTQVLIVKYYLLIVLIILPLLSIIKHKESISRIHLCPLSFLNKPMNILVITLSLLLTFFISYKFTPNYWRFESHDLVYFSWLNDIFKIDYSGPVRVPTGYPSLLSANHLTAGSVLLPFLAFKREINLVDAYWIKFILTTGASFNFFYTYLHSIANKYFSLARIFIASVIIFFIIVIYLSEIHYSWSTSSYLLYILTLTFTSYIIKINYIFNQSEISKENKSIIVFFAYSLLISKASTFPTFLLGIILFIFNNRKTNFIKGFKSSIYSLYLAIFLLALNMLSWIIPTSNHGTLAFSFPFCLLNRGIPKLTCIQSIIQSPFEKWIPIEGFKISILSNLIKSPADGVVIEYIYIWLLAIIPCLISGYLLSRYSYSNLSRFYGNFVSSYSISVAFAVVFLRESLRLAGNHTAHSYLIAPFFTISCIVILLIEHLLEARYNIFSYLPITISIPIIIYVNQITPNAIITRENQLNPSSSNSTVAVSMTIKENKLFDGNYCTNESAILNKFNFHLDSNGCAKADLKELKAAMDGQRTTASLHTKYSQLKGWVSLSEFKPNLQNKKNKNG